MKVRQPARWRVLLYLTLGALAVRCTLDASIAHMSSKGESKGLVAAVDLGPGRTAVMAFSYLEALVERKGGSSWEVAPYQSDRLLFSIQQRREGPNPAVSERSLLEELSAKIRTDEKIKAVHIDDGTLNLEEHEAAPAELDGGKYAGLTTADPQWVLKFMDVFEAWEKIRSEHGRQPGEGVTIGQVDTGLLAHPELWNGSSPQENVLWSESQNFREKGYPNALDLFTTSHLFQSLFPPVPSHGTATASVMISSQGPEGSPGVTGVAPSAKLLPVRSGVSAVYIDVLGGPVARGIDYVSDKEGKIIVLAMGGPVNPLIHKAIREATKKGAIVLAAGGNHARNVPRPALYEETIAIGAGTISCQPWSGTTGGEAIEALAPGQDVWHATAYKRKSGELVYAVRRGVGTSFSTPLAAGVAALWMSYHGFDNLARSYGPENITRVFRWVLQNGGLRPCEGLGENFGGGYLNALRMLETPLPEPELFAK